MNVFEILDYEHQLIGHALQAAQGCARRLAQPGAQMEPLVQELADFSSHFVSECHQVKRVQSFHPSAAEGPFLCHCAHHGLAR